MPGERPLQSSPLSWTPHDCSRRLAEARHCAQLIPRLSGGEQSCPHCPGEGPILEASWPGWVGCSHHGVLVLSAEDFPGRGGREQTMGLSCSAGRGGSSQPSLGPWVPPVTLASCPWPLSCSVGLWEEEGSGSGRRLWLSSGLPQRSWRLIQGTHGDTYPRGVGVGVGELRPARGPVSAWWAALADGGV